MRFTHRIVLLSLLIGIALATLFLALRGQAQAATDEPRAETTPEVSAEVTDEPGTDLPETPDSESDDDPQYAGEDYTDNPADLGESAPDGTYYLDLRSHCGERWSIVNRNADEYTVSVQQWDGENLVYDTEITVPAQGALEFDAPDAITEIWVGPQYVEDIERPHKCGEAIPAPADITEVTLSVDEADSLDPDAVEVVEFVGDQVGDPITVYVELDEDGLHLIFVDVPDGAYAVFEAGEYLGAVDLDDDQVEVRLPEAEEGNTQ